MKKTYIPDLREVYDSLLSVYTIMDTTLDDLHECMKDPRHNLNQMRKDKHVLFHQMTEVGNCMKMLEMISPEECDESLF